MTPIDHLVLKKEVTELLFSTVATYDDDDILRSIHFRRKKRNLEKIFAEYLLAAYKNNNDVRFFNELLWLEADSKSKILECAIKHFYNQLKPDGTYTFCYKSNFKKFLNVHESLSEYNIEHLKNKSVCLIGAPFHFILAYKKLKENNIDVDIINVKYHSNKYFNFIFNSRLFSFFYRLVYKKEDYKEIKVKNKSELSKLSLKKKYDVGFQKLSFIISENLISCFKEGLINDHWGALPLFKGKSTIAYSRLFGANLVITNHLITKNIDRGKIICYSHVREHFLTQDIYLGLKDRIVKSLSLLASEKEFKKADNQKGVVFYEMHDWLSKYVKRNISSNALQPSD